MQILCLRWHIQGWLISDKGEERRCMQMLTSNIYGIWSHLDFHNTDTCRILTLLAILPLQRCNAHALAAGQLPHYCCHRSVQAPVAIIIITIMVTTIIITTMVTKVTITKSIPTRYLDF